MNEALILNIIDIINSILYLVIFYLMLTKIKARKTSIKKINYIIIFVLTILILISPKFKDIVIIKYNILEGFLLMFLYKLTFEISYKDSFLYAFSFAFLYSIIGRIIYTFLINFLFDKVVEYSALSYHSLISIILNVILILLLKYFKQIINAELDIKYYIYVGLTVIINGISILFLFISGEYINDLYKIMEYSDAIPRMSVIPYIQTIQSIIPAIMVFCNIFLIIIINNLIKGMKAKSELESINNKLNMQYNYYLNIQESHMKVRKIYHDINNHLACIKKIENGDVDNYIKSINEELRDFESSFNTGNKILDIILNEKSIDCRNNNIKLLCDINLRKCEFIQMIDISSIFSNILDNAIEACEKVRQGRYIKLRGVIVKSYFIITCENSKNDKLRFKNNILITSKDDKFFHGIGLKSIKSSIKKYDGELEIIEGKDNFTLNIYIPIQN
ncbi:ATP-binding protein [Clostridioides difficile]|nr:sensor histidine kinase VirS [Clostridioides difficile]EGT3796865.1 ATP-binding protein [Clostridioides difficile]EGT4026736.1 ATP-binding protein [Clostridioides difficile]EGT4086710.1 ATP-binding protein [Clostridioides difficile]EGT4095678.1 ATP-binding protein [Clostridioides difficile]